MTPRNISMQTKIVVLVVTFLMGMPAFGAGMGPRHKRFAGSASWWRQFHERQQKKVDSPKINQKESRCPLTKYGVTYGPHWGHRHKHFVPRRSARR